MNFAEFETLTRCHGVGIQGFRACHSAEFSCGSEGFDHFYKTVEAISRSDRNNVFLIANYSRKRLSQTGDGHFSPIAAFHEKEGYVLVLDVARFKYPPYWVKIRDMWDAMAVIDSATNEPRGYFLITSEENGSETMENNSLPKLNLPHNVRVSVCRGSLMQQKSCSANHSHDNHTHCKNH
jgi:glutathione gamma-glutamylcysteinyltransferase